MFHSYYKYDIYFIIIIISKNIQFVLFTRLYR